MKSNSKTTTIKDVARAAGVSAMSVSKALNNRSGVAPKTREKILEAARKLNYTPNSVAQSLRNAKTNTIGVIMSDSSQHVFASLLQGLSDAATAASYSVILVNTIQNSQRESDAVNLLVSKRIDGLLFAAPIQSDSPEIQQLKHMDIPFVFLMRTPGMAQVDYVVNDNYLGGYISAKYLYESGSRDFLFIALDSSTGRERIRGYSAYLEEQGLSVGDMYMEKVPPHISCGCDAMKKILGQGRTSGTICCGCDMIAIGAMNAILESGFKIPDDFRVLGYDDFDLAGYLQVPLSTIRQPIYDIGAKGVELLLNRLENPSAPYQSVILQPKLVVRQST